GERRRAIPAGHFAPRARLEVVRPRLFPLVLPLSGPVPAHLGPALAKKARGGGSGAVDGPPGPSATFSAPFRRVAISAGQSSSSPRQRRSSQRAWYRRS